MYVTSAQCPGVVKKTPSNVRHQKMNNEIEYILMSLYKSGACSHFELLVQFFFPHL